MEFKDVLIISPVCSPRLIDVTLQPQKKEAVDLLRK